MSLVRPLSSISPKGLLVSGHLKNITIPIFKKKAQTNITRRRITAESIKNSLHHTDVMDKLQRERQKFIVGVCSEQTIIYDLLREGKVITAHINSSSTRRFTTTINLTSKAGIFILPARTEKERTWMLAGKHSAARRDRKRCGRIFILTLVLTGSCFSSCFTLPAWWKEHYSINEELRIKD